MGIDYKRNSFTVYFKPLNKFTVMQTKQLTFQNNFQADYLPELCANDKLHVYAFTTDCILYKETANDKVHFLYAIDPNDMDNTMCFDFSLLSECNDNAHGIFTQLLLDLKLSLETVETETDYFQIVKYIGK
jgi:hypothetical protein